MKPRKKGEHGCVLKAMNALTQRSEILVIEIKDHNVIDSLLTILLSLSYYYEAEMRNRDDEDADSDAETETDTETAPSESSPTHTFSQQSEVMTVSLSKDTTLSEHQAEIDRAVFLIENSKKHNNIKTADVAKFLQAKNCPLSVIHHAFAKAGVPVPPQFAQGLVLTGSATPTNTKTHPKSRSQTLREKERRMMAKGSKRHSGKSAGKATKLMGFGFHAEKRARSNSNETRGGLGRSKGKRGVSPIEIRQ